MVDTLEDRINGCMERSMNGRALPLDSREMRAFSSYMRWLSTGIPDGAKIVGYFISQKRPEKANLDKDFPVRLQKPIDTPYGPYVDGFSLEQHKIGPFGPIRAKVQELTTMSRTVKAGEPGNGSSEFDRAR